MTDEKSFHKSFFDGPPSENGARAVLQMEHIWPELDEFVLLEVLAQRYRFDVETLEVAARELEKLNILESQSGFVTRKFFFLIPYQDKVKYFRRRKA